MRVREPTIRLEPLSEAHRAAFTEMLAEFGAHGDIGLYTGFYAVAWDGFDAYRTMLERLHAGGWPLPEVVPGDTLFIMCGDRIVGEVFLRFGLTPALEEDGGNVGYHIRPTARNRGYATQALRLALALLRQRGVPEALVTCDEHNLASIRVIEKCGGSRIADSSICRRYLIDTSQPGLES
jgi:predicted acetyltransferase